MMKGIMTFEGIKFLNSRKNWIIVGIFMFLLFFQMNMINMIANSFKDTSVHFLEQNLTLQETEYENNQTLLEKGTLSGSVRSDIEQLLLFREDMIAKYNRQLLALQLDNPEAYWVTQKEIHEAYLESSTDLSAEQMDRFQRENARVAAIQEQGLPFEQDLNFPSRAWPLMEHILRVMSTTGLILVVLMLIGDHMARDFDDGSIALYHSLMRKKNDLVFYKGMVVTGSSYVILAAIILVFFIGIGFWSGFGSASYPLIVGNLSNGYRVIPMARAVVLVAIHFLFVLLFLVTLATLLGVIFRHSLITIGVLILGYYGFTAVSAQNFLQPYLPFIPFSQLNSYNIITGTDMLTPGIPLWGSVLILLGFSVVNMGMSRVLLRER